MGNSATFRIRRVKCRDEMGGSFRERFGNDEIKCAVFSADLRGSTRNSGRIDIYDDFDDGDEKTFDPPREVVTLDLAGAPGEVDLAFSVILIESQLTEGDGLQKAFQEFVKIYEDSVKAQASKRQMSVEEVRAVAARPGYLSPAPRPFPGVPVTEATITMSPTASVPAFATGKAPAVFSSFLSSSLPVSPVPASPPVAKTVSVANRGALPVASTVFTSRKPASSNAFLSAGIFAFVGLTPRRSAT